MLIINFNVLVFFSDYEYDTGYLIELKPLVETGLSDTEDSFSKLTKAN